MRIFHENAHKNELSSSIFGTIYSYFQHKSIHMQFYTREFNFQKNCLHNWGTLSYHGACFQLPVVRLCILQLQPPYHTHFTSSSLWNLDPQVDPLEQKRDVTGSVTHHCCYNTCFKISQQKHSSCYWPVSTLCSHTLSCWSKTHFLCMGHPTAT